MSTNSEIDKTLLEFAKEVAAIPRRISEEDGALAAVVAQPSPVASIAASPAQVQESAKVSPAWQTAPSLQLRKKSDKKLRTPDELAGLVLTTLREVDDCPRR